MSFKGQGHKETPPRILQIIIWEKKKVSWFDDEDVYVAWFREISWKRNCVQNNKSMYYIRDYLFHISVRYEKELVLILILCTEIQMTNIVKKHCEINFSHTNFSVENNYYNLLFSKADQILSNSNVVLYYIWHLIFSNAVSQIYAFTITVRVNSVTKNEILICCFNFWFRKKNQDIFYTILKIFFERVESEQK